MEANLQSKLLHRHKAPHEHIRRTVVEKELGLCQKCEVQYSLVGFDSLDRRHCFPHLIVC